MRWKIRPNFSIRPEPLSACVITLIGPKKKHLFRIHQFILVHKKRHPNRMGEKEIYTLIAFPATERQLASSAQNQAWNALLFLYKSVPDIQIQNFQTPVRTRRSDCIPAVLSREEVRSILVYPTGAHRLTAMPLYGSRIQWMECLNFPVNEMDIQERRLLVRRGKGGKDRATMLPDTFAAFFNSHSLSPPRTVRQTKFSRAGSGRHTPAGVPARIGQQAAGSGVNPSAPASGETVSQAPIATMRREVALQTPLRWTCSPFPGNNKSSYRMDCFRRGRTSKAGLTPPFAPV